MQILNLYAFLYTYCSYFTHALLLLYIDVYSINDAIENADSSSSLQADAGPDMYLRMC